ncbi:MAG: hypothetical protein KC475_00945 [Cyanobacteria bacterium HKST-UBA03]|nr:hypothetical protein [Cyanobacteria bacterium HKST-UBA03]
MPLPVTLPPFVQAVKEFQQLGLVNKALIDVTAVDVPLIALAKNQSERKERALRQGLVLLVAFLMAPLHARLVSRLMSHGIGIKGHSGANQTLMRLSFNELANTNTMRQGIIRLFRDPSGKVPLQNRIPLPLKRRLGPRALEHLRKRVLNAKSHFLMTDLAVCGLLLSSIGFIKVAFGKLMSGKNQFSGEFGIVNTNVLDALYRHEHQGDHEALQAKTQLKQAITFSTAIGVPVLLGLLVRHGLKTPNPKGLNRFITQKLAPRLDYNYPSYLKSLKGWPLLSDGAQILLSLMLTMGELTSARSKRELKELAIQRNSIDAMFFFGAPMFMKALSGSTTVQGAIDRARFKVPHLVQQAARRSARTYLASFLLTLACVSAIVAKTNQITRQAVKDDANRLTPRPYTDPRISPRTSPVGSPNPQPTGP